MANNCIGVGFDMSCDGSGNTMDSGEYLQGVGLPLSGGVDGLDQTGMSASNCNSLATSHFQENNCEMMAGQDTLSRLSRQATQRQSIPPLGPRATMRSASGKTFAQIRDEETKKKLVGFVALTAASAYIGSRIAKNKRRGAVIGGVGYVIAVVLYMKSRNK
tara:strand:- start:41 stop:523 length:483 start_codon:yes stop_codon:yes gene_type:complete